LLTRPVKSCKSRTLQKFAILANNFEIAIGAAAE